ncbi:microtubule motor activity protein [Homalodisca vitripennis]|nr:microtubule motor activity protein [Homalodisca vitripennis]
MDLLSLEQEVGAWDSVLLDPLTEDSFIANLHQRFKRDHIYVSNITDYLSVFVVPDVTLVGRCHVWNVKWRQAEDESYDCDPDKEYFCILVPVSRLQE